MSNLIFVPEFFVSVLLPGIAIFGIFISKLYDNKTIKNNELLLLSLGIGPAFNVWLINSLLLLMPDLPPLCYILPPTIIYLVIIFIHHKHILIYLNNIRTKGLNIENRYKFPLLIIFTAFLVFTLYSVKNMSIVGRQHEMLKTPEGKYILQRSTNWKVIFDLDSQIEASRSGKYRFVINNLK